MSKLKEDETRKKLNEMKSIELCLPHFSLIAYQSLFWG
jgi:hypothetical protein